jgi:hypothetical protein
MIGFKRKASDSEGASSSAAKNNNANQVVGLDSGSGISTQGSVPGVDGSDTNTQQT